MQTTTSADEAVSPKVQRLFHKCMTNKQQPWQSVLVLRRARSTILWLRRTGRFEKLRVMSFADQVWIILWRRRGSQIWDDWPTLEPDHTWSTKRCARILLPAVGQRLGACSGRATMWKFDIPLHFEAPNFLKVRLRVGSNELACICRGNRIWVVCRPLSGDAILFAGQIYVLDLLPAIWKLVRLNLQILSGRQDIFLGKSQ